MIEAAFREGAMEVRCFGKPPHRWVVQDMDGGSWRDSDHWDESMGTKEKRWVEGPDGQRWLFKYVRPRQGSAAGNLQLLGEDWSECTVHALAGLLGVPSACVAPAMRQGARGIVSKSFVAADQRLEHGNELLAGVVQGYRDVPRENPHYTPTTVRQAFQGVEPPSEMGSLGAFEVWCGYLVLDAWVAGRDRHPENWGVLRDDTRVVLAPSFDHGNALGFQEPEHTVENMLAQGPDRILGWCQRGRSHHFAGKPCLTSVAADALKLCSEAARRHWADRLHQVDQAEVEKILDAVPQEILSVSRSRFVRQLLQVNRRRLLDEISN